MRHIVSQSVFILNVDFLSFSLEQSFLLQLSSVKSLLIHQLLRGLEAGRLDTMLAATLSRPHRPLTHPTPPDPVGLSSSRHFQSMPRTTKAPDTMCFNMLVRRSEHSAS